MKRNKKLILFIGVVTVIFLHLQMTPLHPDMQCSATSMMSSPDSLYEGANAEFSSAGKCDHCHGADPSGLANVNAEGGDVNVVDDWSSSMMALSARDPYWRAKVSHEVWVNPQLQNEIETTCTKCHAPLGHFAATMNGAEQYSIAEMLQDSVALDGVSCNACHSQLPQPAVALHTGQLLFEDDSIEYGPYFNPLVTPMALYSGYTPEQSFHIRDSKLCAACHSLITETVDLEGNLNGNDFVEQATWHEWLNSSYPVQEVSCQQCHLPQLQDQAVVLATGYDTPPRSPYGLHTLAGGNVTMLRLMRDFREELNIYPSASQFNETISATENMLQQQSLQLQLTEQLRTEDTLYIDALLTNLAGHKLPSGYPARRMTLVLYVSETSNTEIFRSGGFTDDFHVVNENLPFEPHHNIITDEEQVQIYEMVMGDVEGNKTTVLNRGAMHLKDNRLVPAGFSSLSAQYDTTEIVLSLTDTDFNHNPNEGSGTDIVHYHIPTNSFTGALQVHAEIYYQSVPPSWVEGFDNANTPEILSFQQMFSTTDQSPVLMKVQTLNVPAYNNIAHANTVDSHLQYIKDGRFLLNATEVITLSIYHTNGQLLMSDQYQPGKHALKLSISKGMYLSILRTQSGKVITEKLIVN